MTLFTVRARVAHPPIASLRTLWVDSPSLMNLTMCRFPALAVLFAAAVSLPARADDTPPIRLNGHGKLLLTGGVASIDGAGGGGLTPWALTATYATEGEAGIAGHVSRAITQDYALTAVGVTTAWNDRVELSLAAQALNASSAVPDSTLNLTIAGVKWRVWGDAVLDSDRWAPQLALGAQVKHVAPGPAVGAVLDSVGAHRDGIDLYASATKLFLAQGVLANLTLRATKANQNGLLGFGSTTHDQYHWQPEASLAWLPARMVAIGVELRSKPDNLAFAGDALREDAWKDAFVAWAPNKHVSATLAWVDLGNIVGHPHQHGGYLSLQFVP